MTRALAAMLAAIFILAAPGPAVCSSLRAADDISIYPLRVPHPRHHIVAYASMIVGCGLIAGSFAYADRANEAYDRYLVATEPEEIDALFASTEHYDRLSSGALLAGELLVAAGLYLRFLRPSPESRLSFSAGPEHCRVAFRF